MPLFVLLLLSFTLFLQVFRFFFFKCRLLNFLNDFQLLLDLVAEFFFTLKRLINLNLLHLRVVVEVFSVRPVLLKTDYIVKFLVIN